MCFVNFSSVGCTFGAASYVQFGICSVMLTSFIALIV